MVSEPSHEKNLKGYIECPYGCGEKDLAFEGAVGVVSHKCPRCGKYVLYDYAGMKAFKSNARRGAVHELKFKALNLLGEQKNRPLPELP